MRRKIDGRSRDKEFSWLTKNHGPQWETWRLFASEWIINSRENLGGKIKFLTAFLDRYLCPHVHYAAAPIEFFRGYEGHRCSTEEFKKKLQTADNPPGEMTVANCVNYTSAFLDWVIKKHFSEADDHGKYVPIFLNPIQKIKRKETRLSETCRSSLPYRYIAELRSILCPQPFGDFRNWKWAQEQTGQGGGKLGDWFEVDPSLVDRNDPDCVWREKKVGRQIKGKGKKQFHIYQIWSPVRAVALLIKLFLPLRTTQVRLLDSGEADTFRYINGEWIENNVHSFVMGSVSSPLEKGVFRRIKKSGSDGWLTGLYINSNKTADRGREEFDRGYIIPYHFDEVVYWLEKLRNWQEKYNPITTPTDCTTLLPKHTGHVKSKTQLSSLGRICFLFRDPTANGDDREKPLNEMILQRIWRCLLIEFEACLNADLEPGRIPVRLVKKCNNSVKDSDRNSTEFPLHALRVSLITHYLTETDLPLAVVSMFLAGHSRLAMTIYYEKIGPRKMGELMGDALRAMEESASENLKKSLHERGFNSMRPVLACNDENSARAMADNRNPVGWEPNFIGLCLAGCNPLHSEESSSVVGCWNGGPEIPGAKRGRKSRSSVPHGPMNCVRCRWFVTDSGHLLALNVHFNLLYFKRHEIMEKVRRLEKENNALMEEKLRCQTEGILFENRNSLDHIRERIDTLVTEADEFGCDAVATLVLIQKIQEIESDRTENDTRDLLVAPGDRESVDSIRGLSKIGSETLHLALLGHGAVIFPESMDEIVKTSAVERLSRIIDRGLVRNGTRPFLLGLDSRSQAFAANAIIRRMAHLSGHDGDFAGIAKAADLIDAGEIRIDRTTVFEIGKLLADRLQSSAEIPLIPETF
jgi:hypothetical protein